MNLRGLQMVESWPLVSEEEAISPGARNSPHDTKGHQILICGQQIHFSRRPISSREVLGEQSMSKLRAEGEISVAQGAQPFDECYKRSLTWRATAACCKL